MALDNFQIDQPIVTSDLVNIILNSAGSNIFSFI